MLIDPKYSTTMDTTTCPITASLFVLDDLTNMWVEDSTSAFSNAWISSFNTSKGANVAGYLSIFQADTGFIAEKTYTVKIKLKDLQSMDATAATSETIFKVTVYHKCSRNTFTLNDITDQSYAIAATGIASAISIPKSTVTGNTVGCTLEYTIEIFDSSRNDWTVISSVNQASKYTFIVANANLDLLSTNTFDIQTADFATWANTS